MINAKEKKMKLSRKANLFLFAIFMLLILPFQAKAAVTLADIVSEIPADISVQAGGSTTDLSKDIITLSYSVTTASTGVKLTGITVGDAGTITGTDAGLRVYINNKGKYTTRGAILALSKNYGTWTKGTSIPFDTQVPLTQNVKAYVFIVYDLTNTAASKTTKTTVTAMTISGDTWSGSATTANTTSIIAKTACVDEIKVNDCGKCHNYNGYYQVFYPYSSPTTRGSHLKHAGMKKFECWRCHNNVNNYFARYTGIAPLHQNGAADIGPKIYDNSTTVGGTWSSVNKTCSTVDCHFGNTTPKWGTQNIACTACHATPPATGAHSQHFASLGITANQTNYCYFCHNGAGSGSPLHGDGTVDVNIAVSLTNSLFNDINVVASYTPNGSANGTCSNVSCHGGLTTYNWTSGTGTSYNPADAKYKILIASGTISGRAVPASETRAAGWLKCTACHAVDNLTAGTESNITHWNSARSGKHYSHAIGSGADSTLKSYTGQVSGTNFDRKRIRVAKCYVCHNDAHYDNTASDYRFKVTAGQYNVTTSDFDANTGATAAPNNIGGAVNGNTIFTYTDSSTTVQSQTINGTSYTQNVYYKDGANSWTTGTCSTNCHGGGTWSYTASLDCTTCHAQVQGGKVAAVVNEFSMSSHHVQGPTVNAQHCYTCHWEADYNAGNASYLKNSTYHGDGRVDLVIYGISTNTRPTTSNTATRTVFNRYSLIATIKANSHCLGCHNANGKTNTPFGDGKTPNQYSWDGSSVAERYASFTTYSSHKYNPATYNVVPQKRKTSSSHYAMNIHKRGVMVGQAWQDDQTAFIATNSYTSTNAGSVACLDCHNSHGSNLQYGNLGFTSYSSATGKYKGGILKQTWAGTHGYTVNYTPTEAYYVNNLGGAGSRRSAIWSAQAALCFDCHLGEDTKSGGVGAATTSMPRNYMQYGRAKGNVVAGYYDALDYEAAYAANNRQLLHGQGRWYIDNSNAGYSNTTNNSSPAFWQGEFTYKKGTIIGSHFMKHPGNTVTGYTPRNWRDSANSGNTNSNFLGGGMGLRGMCTFCHDPHGVNVAKDPANISYYSPQLKGRWLTAPYFEDRPGNRESGTNSEQVYANLMSLVNVNTLNNTRVAPRMLPTKRLNRPRQTGLGYGFGLDDTTVKGQDGFFIDDNTFGVTINNGTTAIDLFGNNNLSTINSLSYWFSGWSNGNGAKTFGTGGTVTTNTITETDVQFAGLCLGCHPKNTLLNSRSSNSTRIAAFQTRAHRTVKGWMTAYSSVTTGRAADIVPDYYLNRASARVTQGFTGANNNANFAMSPQYTYTIAGTSGFRGIGTDVGSGYHISWGLWYGKQADANGANNVQVQYHNFPCSKCHTTHGARLPRLLKTNCLDVWQSKDVANNWAPANDIFRQKHSTNTTNNWLQRMPFITANIPPTNTTTNLANVTNWNPARPTRCHNSPLVKTDQYQTRWNDVTPWN